MAGVSSKCYHLLKSINYNNVKYKNRTFVCKFCKRIQVLLAVTLYSEHSHCHILKSQLKNISHLLLNQLF